MKIITTVRQIEFCDECDHITNRVRRLKGHLVAIIPVCAAKHRRKLGEDGAIHIKPPKWCPLPEVE
jgi:hypothetical protein